MWGWALAWLGARELNRLGRDLERAERGRKQALREQKRAVALLLKDEPEERWRAYGLDKRAMLRELGIKSEDAPAARGVEFYSSIGRGKL